MSGTIGCLVDRDGHVYVNDEAVESATLLSTVASCQSGTCQAYEYDLVSRRLLDKRVPDRALIDFLGRHFSTPRQLMEYAAEGHLSKTALAELLDDGARFAFLRACEPIERQYTAECASGEPCLESGCSIDQAEGEACLQPLLRAGSEYAKACAAVWIPLFSTPSNRISTWR
jgi:hypothetical protein